MSRLLYWKYLLGIMASALALLFVFSGQTRAAGRDVVFEASGADRIALVIGNSDYESAPLANPVNDAQAMAKALAGLGFEVILHENADKKSIVEAMDEFGKKLRSAQVGLFYYAGHGMQVDGQNYLIPVRSHITEESDVEFEAVAAERVLHKMENAGNEINIVVLDACRNNPFARSFRSSSRGLAQMDAPRGSFIAFATAPGSVAADGEGDNGVFTKHLLLHIGEPGLPIEQLLKKVRNGVLAETGEKQIPWQSSSLTGDFYFAESGPTQASGSQVPEPSDLERLLAEERKRLDEEKRQLLVLRQQQLKEESLQLEAERKRIEDLRQGNDTTTGRTDRTQRPTPMEARTRVLEFLEVSNRNDVAAYLELLAPTVDFYKAGRVGHDFISRDKTDFYKYWPERTYTLNGDVQISETTEGLVASFIVNYRVKNPKTGKAGAGRSSISLIIVDSSGRIEIADIKETLIK